MVWHVRLVWPIKNLAFHPFLKHNPANNATICCTVGDYWSRNLPVVFSLDTLRISPANGMQRNFELGWKLKIGRVEECRHDSICTKDSIWRSSDTHNHRIQSSKASYAAGIALRCLTDWQWRPRSSPHRQRCGGEVSSDDVGGVDTSHRPQTVDEVLLARLNRLSVVMLSHHPQVEDAVRRAGLRCKVRHVSAIILLDVWRV